MNDQRIISTPLDRKTTAGLKLGEIVYLTGRVFTARDQAHLLMLKDGIPDKLKTRGMALYHCGPVAKKKGDGWDVLSAGPTTSLRMETLEPRFLEMSGALAIIGKGGMGASTLAALKKAGAVYLSITGGVGATAMRQLGPVRGVHFLEELGPVEAVWEFDATGLGPLVITMDAHGNSLHDDAAAMTRNNLDAILNKK